MALLGGGDGLEGEAGPQAATAPYVMQAATAPYVMQAATAPYVMQAATAPYVMQAATAPDEPWHSLVAVAEEGETQEQQHSATNEHLEPPPRLPATDVSGQVAPRTRHGLPQTSFPERLVFEGQNMMQSVGRLFSDTATATVERVRSAS